MTRTVAIVDYGMGNLRSVSQAVLHVAAESGYRVIVTRAPEEVMTAERVVLPGQGAMRDCMRELRESGLQQAVLEAAASKPLMGICVGMQMLLDHSEEQDTPGLGLIPGQVRRFQLSGRLQPDGSRYKVPQMGWNQVFAQTQGGAPHPVWEGVPEGSYFYRLCLSGFFLLAPFLLLLAFGRGLGLFLPSFLLPSIFLALFLLLLLLGDFLGSFDAAFFLKEFEIASQGV